LSTANIPSWTDIPVITMDLALFHMSKAVYRLRAAAARGNVLANVPDRKFCDFIPCKAVCMEGPYDVESDVEACLRMSIGNVCPVQSEQGYTPLGPWSQ
jgi:hypothetical protein